MINVRSAENMTLLNGMKAVSPKKTPTKVTVMKDLETMLPKPPGSIADLWTRPHPQLLTKAGAVMNKLVQQPLSVKAMEEANDARRFLVESSKKNKLRRETQRLLDLDFKTKSDKIGEPS